MEKQGAERTATDAIPIVPTEKHQLRTDVAGKQKRALFAAAHGGIVVLALR